MKALGILLELLRAIPAVVRAYKRNEPVPPRVDVKPIKMPSRYPSAIIDDGDGKPRVL